jgi:hypothetical protein
LWAYRLRLENRAKAARVRAEQRRIADSRRAKSRLETYAENKSISINESRGLSADELDAENGQLRWPDVLQGTTFADVRSQLDALFVERALRPGQGTETCLHIQSVTDEFHKKLKSKIRDLPAKDYIAGDKFLKKLRYEIRVDVGVRQNAASEKPAKKGPSI